MVASVYFCSCKGPKLSCRAYLNNLQLSSTLALNGPETLRSNWIYYSYSKNNFIFIGYHKPELVFQCGAILMHHIPFERFFKRLIFKVNSAFKAKHKEKLSLIWKVDIFVHMRFTSLHRHHIIRHAQHYVEHWFPFIYTFIHLNKV